MKRVLSLVLALVMLVSCAAILTACPKPCTEHVDANGDYLCDNCGVVVRKEGNYTYNTYLSEFPSTWNSHVYQTATDGEILGYTEPGFYTFDYNETKDGFVVVPEIAASMPIDVTADYVGDEWGILEDDTARAWKIVLRDDLRWEDGTPIKASEFEESAKRLLDPERINYRADSLYGGNLKIVGAREYFYGGREVKDAKTMISAAFGDDEYWALADLTVNADGQLSNENGSIWYKVDSAANWSTANSLTDYYNAGYLTEEVGAAYAALLETAVDKFVPVTTEVAELLMDVVANLHGCVDADAYAAALEAAGEDAGYAYLEWEEAVYYGQMYEVQEWDTVGIDVVSDTEIVIILEDPLEGFYLHYSLTGNLGLVHIPTYDACAEWKDGIYSTTYGTSVDTYMSYGPYKLTYYQTDKQIVLEHNDQWYGYTDPAYAGQYQTTKVVYDWIDDPETAFNKFLQGDLDAKGLEAKNINDYVGSEHIYYTDGSSTWFIALNPNESAFAAWEDEHPGYDKSILTVKEFRMAISFALNRQDFIKALDPMGSIGLALFNNMICSDPENGIMYRTEEAAKDVILEFWGVSADDIGAGKLYADKDEAIASVTGYNLAGAKELFDQAYDKAVESGLYNGTDKIQICIGTPNATSNFYNSGYTFLVNCYTEAVKGTKLEGLLEFTNDNTLGNGFADALRANTVDMLFGVGWTGSALDPYGLIGAYTYPNYQYDPAWNTATAMMDFEIEGKTYRASVLDWTYACEGSKTIEVYEVDAEGNTTGETMSYRCGTADEKPEERILLLAAIEGAVLRNYDMIPTHNEASASLKGMQITYGTEEYVYGVGRGGIQYMTYNYTDEEWAAFVASQGGILNYK